MGNMDAETRPARKGRILGSGIVALLTSIVPILGVSAAIAASIFSIPRIGDSETRTVAIVALIPVGLSIPIAIGSAVSGVSRIDEWEERSQARPSIEPVHLRMEGVVPPAGAVRARNIQKNRNWLCAFSGRAKMLPKIAVAENHRTILSL